MATNKKISALPTVSSINTTDLFTTVRPSDPISSRNKQNVGSQVRDFILTNQLQAYYVADSGSDTNSGLRDDDAFLTVGKAITEVLAQTPSSSNRFGIVVIGAMRILENITIPTYTTVIAIEGAKFFGTVNIDADQSKLVVEDITTGGAGTNAIVKTSSGSGTSFIDVLGLCDIGDFNGIVNESSGVVHFSAKSLKLAPSTSSKAGILNTGSGELHVKAQKIDASAGSLYTIRPSAGTIYVTAPTIIGTSSNVVFGSDTDQGTLYVNSENITGSTNLVNLISGNTCTIHINAAKATGNLTGLTSSVYLNINRGPGSANRYFTWRDGKALLKSDSVTSLEIEGAGGSFSWSSLRLFGDASLFRANGVKMLNRTNSNEWWAGIAYNTGGDYVIRYDTTGSSENTGTTLIQMTVSGNVYLPNIGTIASTTGYNQLYGNATTGIVKQFTSSQAFKTDIMDMEDTSWLYQLRPRNFKSTIEDDDPEIQYGLISEEVALVNPRIGRDNTVHYEQLISVLINELKKLNDRVIALEAK